MALASRSAGWSTALAGIPTRRAPTWRRCRWRASPRRPPYRSEGRGRPALGYTLTASGQAALRGDPTVTAYAELVGALAAHLAHEPDAAAQARAIGQTWGHAKTRHATPDDAIRLLSDLDSPPPSRGAPSGCAPARSWTPPKSTPTWSAPFTRAWCRRPRGTPTPN
ncbi:hypothetical protein [Propioniciclava flava]